MKFFVVCLGVSSGSEGGDIISEEEVAVIGATGLVKLVFKFGKSIRP